MIISHNVTITEPLIVSLYFYSCCLFSEKIKHRFPGQVSEYECKVISHGDKQIILGSLDQFGEVVINHFRKQISEQYPDLSLEKEASDTEIRKAQQEDFMLQRSQVRNHHGVEVFKFTLLSWMKHSY